MTTITPVTEYTLTGKESPENDKAWDLAVVDALDLNLGLEQNNILEKVFTASLTPACTTHSPSFWP